VQLLVVSDPVDKEHDLIAESFHPSEVFGRDVIF